MENIYIIGKNKSDNLLVANELSRFLPFRVVDITSTVEMLEENKAEDIISAKGRDAYNKMEQQLLSVLSKEENQIIVSGASTFEYDESAEIMRSSGVVCFIADDDKDYGVDISVNANQLTPQEAASELVKQFALTGRLH